jgi:hypothetical protein
MNLRIFALVCAAMLGAGAAFAQPQPASPQIGDQLATWITKTFDEAYVKPDANLASYRKVMLEQPQIVFRTNWLRDINRTRDVSRWLTPADQQKIADDMSAGMGQAFADVFKSQGYEVVTAPGPGVLRVTPSVTDLYLNAPDIQSSNLTRTFNRETADATLVVDARDAVNGAVLAHFVDRRTVRDTVGQAPKYTSDVQNLFWMEAASRTVATNAIKEFEATPDRVRTSSAAGR